MTKQTALSNKEAGELLARSPEQLYEIMGIRIKAGQEDFSNLGVLDPKIKYSEHMGLMEDLQKIGRRMFNKLQMQAYTLICGSDPEDEVDRSKILAALGVGTQTAVIALTSVLINSCGVAVGLAGVLAAIIIKRFAEPTLREGHAGLCELWKENLPVNK